jgi:hypothetical protein
MKKFILLVFVLAFIFVAFQVYQNRDKYDGGVVGSTPVVQPVPVSNPVSAPVLVVLPTQPLPTVLVDNTLPRTGVTPGTTGSHDAGRKDSRNP